MNIKLNGKDFFRITGKYAEKDALHPHGHHGIDLALPTGTEIHSPVDGTVVKVQDLGDLNAGKYIKLRTEDGDTDLIFGHLSEFKVKVGEHIDKGDLLALSGNTGHSTGPHLHFGAKSAVSGEWLDPSHWVDIFQQVSAEILGFIILFF